MQISLEGKVAVVTGASKGIGKAIASEMVGAGARVMLTSRKLDQLQAAAAEIGGETAVFAGNAGDSATAQACVAATIERFGRLDIVVNNAATNPHYGPMSDVDEPKFDKTVQVNLRGPLFWCREAQRQGFAQHPGVIVNISSVGGLRTEYGLGVYNMTKAAMMYMTRQLASELGPTRVVCVAPGLIETDFSQVLVDSFGEKLKQTLPLGRLGMPSDVANLVVFLASERASYVTGETFVIDGGFATLGVGG